MEPGTITTMLAQSVQPGTFSLRVALLVTSYVVVVLVLLGSVGVALYLVVSDRQVPNALWGLIGTPLGYLGGSVSTFLAIPAEGQARGSARDEVEG